MNNFGARVISGLAETRLHRSDVLKELQRLSTENLWRGHSLTILKRMLHSGQPEIAEKPFSGSRQRPRL